MKKQKKKIIKEKDNKSIRFERVTTIISIILTIISIIYAHLVRKDTEELAKFTDKPVYYTINLYRNENTAETVVHDKYLSVDLTLSVDAFEIKKKNFLDINYNAAFTKIKYYFVYDYDLENKDYKYMRYTLDDKLTAELRLDDAYYALPTRLNYSFTPNKEYCYLLIYTETTTEKNLDLIFFKYNDEGETVDLDLIYEDDVEKIDIERIDYDAVICKDYFIDLWAEDDKNKISDIEYMYDVYNDLREKVIYE